MSDNSISCDDCRCRSYVCACIVMNLTRLDERARITLKERDTIRADLAAAREKNSELNRRCQAYEAGLADALKPLGGRTLGRALANAAAVMMMRERDEARAYAKSRADTCIAAERLALVVREHFRLYDRNDLATYLDCKGVDEAIAEYDEARGKGGGDG